MGPLLFNMFINDIFQVVHYSNIDLFADDCKIYMKILGVVDSLKLQADLNNVYNLINSNKLEINRSKCEKITFSRKNKLIIFDYNILDSTINSVKKVRDLGVILDQHWSFDDHLNNVLSKAYKALSFIKR